MRAYFVQEKTIHGWKPATKRTLARTFDSRREALGAIRHYVRRNHDKTATGDYRVLWVSA